MSGVDAGLSGAEAARRLGEYGTNEPIPRKRFPAAVQLAQLFANPLAIILLVAGGISSLIGEEADALIIVTLVLLGSLPTSGTRIDRSARSIGCAPR